MITYSRILIATDFSPLAQFAIRAGEALARVAGAKELHLAHVVGTSSKAALFPHSGGPELPKLYQAGAEQAEKRLAQISVEVEGATLHRHVRLGAPAQEVAKLAEELEIDLIVVASHGYGALGRTILGSVSSSLIRSAHCPILIVGKNRQGLPPFKNVLVAVDLSPVSLLAAEQALAMTESGGRLTALSLFEHPLTSHDAGELLPRYFSDEEIEKLRDGHRKNVQKLLNKLPEHEGVEVKLEVMSKAPPPLVILETAEILHSDLIVVGTSGHNAWHRMIIGSTATKVLADANCPVLVVPPPAENEDAAE